VPADRLYLAFVTAAQGEDTLPPGFDQRFGRTGLTVGGVWSHSHGLHVLPMVTDTTEDLLRGLAADWIALAWSAEAEPVMIGYEFRAIAALEVGFDSVLTPLLRQGAIVDLSAVSPALARTGELFDLCTSFAAEPEWVLDELLQVYESLPGPDGIRAPRPAAGASPYSVLPQVIAAQLDRFAARLADVEVPDRRVLLRAAGGAR
jgi:hypothetical protein